MLKGLQIFSFCYFEPPWCVIFLSCNSKHTLSSHKITIFSTHYQNNPPFQQSIISNTMNKYINTIWIDFINYFEIKSTTQSSPSMLLSLSLPSPKALAADSSFSLLPFPLTVPFLWIASNRLVNSPKKSACFSLFSLVYSMCIYVFSMFFFFLFVYLCWAKGNI